VAHHATLLYHIPRWFPITPIAIAFAEVWAGFDADRVDAVAAARDIHAPLLLISDGADPRMPPDVVKRVFDAHPGPKTLWLVPGAAHLGAMERSDYERRITEFLDEKGL
jgi:pimeloyl-ACP methyl ester carboxylesterase